MAQYVDKDMMIKDAEAAVAVIKLATVFGDDAFINGELKAYEDFLDALKEYEVADVIPRSKAVPRDTYEQVVWERDMAFKQLKELGYGFCEKKHE